MLKRVIYVLGILLVIPIIGFAVSSWIIFDIDKGLANEGLPSLALICELVEVESDPDVQAACSELSLISLLRVSSLVTAIVAIALVSLNIVAAMVAGRNRRLNAAIFPKLIPLTLAVVSLLVLAQGAILTYAAYVGESYAIERVHFFIIGAIGIGAVAACVKLIGATLSIRGQLEIKTVASKVERNRAPSLWNFVDTIAARIGATPPSNIVVGLEPTFYATAANVNLINEGQVVSGETLYLSESLMRLLTRDELASVVGHELGHFHGQDVAYSMKFAPVYRGLGQALGSLGAGDEEGVSGLAKIPAFAMLSLALELFARNESAVSRVRELEADKVGASIGSPSALATALAKVAIFSGLWSKVQNENVDRLNAGKVTKNLAQVFEDSAQYDLSKSDITDILGQILETQIAHPTDSHPTIRDRYASLGFDPNQLTTEALLQFDSGLRNLIENADELEQQLTFDEHKLMVALGLAGPPADDATGPGTFLNAMYALAAHVAAADGKVVQEEVVRAEQIGKQIFDGFDAVEFREFCKNRDALPELKSLVQTLNEVLTEEHKEKLLDYLEKIAMADSEFSDSERRLLQDVKALWGIN